MNVKERFSFIQDPVLKNEIDQNLMFVMKLIDLFENTPNNGIYEIMRFWYKKTIIIFTASIVEAVLLYTIKILEIKHDRCFWIKKIKEKEIFKISDDEKLWLYKEKKVKYDPRIMTFDDSISILGDEKWDIFTDDICNKIHELRNLRNGVHIHSNLSIDPQFIAIWFEDFFSYTKIAIDCCKNVLLEI